jgi:hypothetical protein
VKSAKLLFFLLFQIGAFTCYANVPGVGAVKKVLKRDIIRLANQAMQESPVTITAFQSDRSAGGKHDFFSEGDYWWPNPSDVTGPYIQKDGLTNPDNFIQHRQVMIRFSQLIGTLTSAYLLTGNKNYVSKITAHLNAWFIDTATRMNPSLLYAQAIKGRVTGRSIGIIDMIQLVEVAQSVRVLEKKEKLDTAIVSAVKNWFAQYLQWVTTHPYGIEERDTKNNHATCWVMQVAVFARLVNDESILNDCINRFKTILLPAQMALDGSFPLELKRSKPYGYSLFNLDAMTTICQVLSTSTANLWRYTLADGRSLKKGMEYMYPFVVDKKRWSLTPDIMYWDNWPIAQSFLLFGALHYQEQSWLDTWKKLEHNPTTDEVIRNFPIRNPLLWLENNTL